MRCPRCGFEAKEHGSKEFHWVCYNCAPESSYRFSVLVDTVFENTNKPLRDWFRVIHMMMTSKKGVSALQVFRTLGFGSYNTAWFMCHRIRAGLQEKKFRQLIGVVEVDETFVGGKAKNKHKGPGGRGGMGGTGGTGKAIVMGAVRRKGNVVARVIANTGVAEIGKFVREVVSHKVSLLCADDHSAYKPLFREFPLGVVDHERDQYVCGAIHTQTIEGFWSLVKRGIMGSYHKVSSKYLPLYVAEFSFRYNNRENEDIFGAAIRGCKWRGA